MSTFTESSDPFVPPREVQGGDESFDVMVKKSHEGGNSADAENIARLLGPSPDPDFADQVQRYIDNGGRGYDD